MRSQLNANLLRDLLQPIGIKVEEEKPGVELVGRIIVTVLWFIICCGLALLIGLKNSAIVFSFGLIILGAVFLR